MKSLDMGCWENFKKKHKTEIVKWVEEQAKEKGIILEDDTEILFNFQHPEEKKIFFGKEAIDETIGYVAKLKRCRTRGIYPERKKIFNVA